MTALMFLQTILERVFRSRWRCLFAGASAVDATDDSATGTSGLAGFCSARYPAVVLCALRRHRLNPYAEEATAGCISRVMAACGEEGGTRRHRFY